ncbi:MAG: 2Fe-2S iron-sulfur cluster-binding protein, partial [Thermoanaerobaculales bacterium]
GTKRHELRVNGQAVSVVADADELLLWVLRDRLQLTGTKFGCGEGVCGALLLPKYHIQLTGVESADLEAAAASPGVELALLSNEVRKSLPRGCGELPSFPPWAPSPMPCTTPSA